MADVDPLVAFCRDRISEDRAAALAAPPGHWEWVDRGHSAQLWAMENDDAPRLVLAVDQDVIFRRGPAEDDAWISSTGTSLHIARFDPARVLADCDAKTAILDLYANTVEWSRRPGGTPADSAPASMAVGVMQDAVQLLAQPYRYGPDGTQHPEWQEEWKIDD